MALPTSGEQQEPTGGQLQAGVRAALPSQLGLPWAGEAFSQQSSCLLPRDSKASPLLPPERCRTEEARIRQTQGSHRGQGCPLAPAPTSAPPEQLTSHQGVGQIAGGHQVRAEGRGFQMRHGKKPGAKVCSHWSRNTGMAAWLLGFVVLKTQLTKLWFISLGQ